MRALPPGSLHAVRVDDLPWRPSAAAPGVLVRDIAVTDGWEMQMVRCEPGARFPAHTHPGPEFVFVLEGELVQGERRLGPGWAGVGAAGSVDADVHSEVGCIFILVDRELIGSKVFILLGSLFRLDRFEGQRLLRFQHRLRQPGVAAADAGDRLVLGQVIKAGRAFGAATLGAPFGFDHRVTSP